MTSKSTPLMYTFNEPWPDRIVDDIGTAFAVGAIGGSMYHFIKGMYNSPNGERIFGGGQAIRMNAPRVAGRFAVWSGLYSACDFCAAYIRQKEDRWNSVAAGTGASGILYIRKGLRHASRSALFGGVLFALLEGGIIMLDKAVDGLVREDPWRDI